MANSSQAAWDSRLFSRAANKFHSMWLAKTYPFASIGKGVSIHRSCDLQRYAAKYIRLGDGVLIGHNVWINVAEMPDHGQPIIILEDGCKVGRGCVISAKNCIHIERNTSFGPCVFVTDHNHAFDDITLPIGVQGVTPGGTVRIGEGSWLGFGAAIVCNEGELVIGRNSVIGANSLASRSVPPYSIVLGNPARTVRHYDTSREQWVLG
jgi:acetyltransferase-like isoleucine patch superfamily enzyme